jgi:hypothetical protein
MFVHIYSEETEGKSEHQLQWCQYPEVHSTLTLIITRLLPFNDHDLKEALAEITLIWQTPNRRGL